jgi:hypothetical protein
LQDFAQHFLGAIGGRWQRPRGGLIESNAQFVAKPER